MGAATIGGDSRTETTEHRSVFSLLQARVFVARLEQRRNVRIGRRPASQELLVGFEATGYISGDSARPRQAQGRYGAERRERVRASMIQNALELFGCLQTGPLHQVQLAAQVNRRESCSQAGLVRRRAPKLLDSLFRPLAIQLDSGLNNRSKDQVNDGVIGMSICQFTDDGLCVADRSAYRQC